MEENKQEGGDEESVNFEGIDNEASCYLWRIVCDDHGEENCLCHQVMNNQAQVPLLFNVIETNEWKLQVPINPNIEPCCKSVHKKWRQYKQKDKNGKIVCVIFRNIHSCITAARETDPQAIKDIGMKRGCDRCVKVMLRK